VGTELTSPLSTAGFVNEQSTLMRSDPMTSGGRVQLVDIIFRRKTGWLGRADWQLEKYCVKPMR